ncbi:hypothetical protein D3P04_06515 [Paracoccus onubensis]|uniref:Uncharacterized protein n=1 Tax=Paracoccus onubensis TaxID=1675788 RepID=A0A418T2G6_9RHOB|nr:hypothetical protein D3P04_06515 [Paracoccus onubensis]
MRQVLQGAYRGLDAFFPHLGQRGYYAGLAGRRFRNGLEYTCTSICEALAGNAKKMCRDEKRSVK